MSQKYNTSHIKNKFIQMYNYENMYIYKFIVPVKVTCTRYTIHKYSSVMYSRALPSRITAQFMCSSTWNMKVGMVLLCCKAET